MLVPASAFALTDAATDTQTAGAASELQASIADHRITLNRDVNVTGLAPAPDTGQWAVLEAAPSSQAPWRYVASSQIQPDGSFRLRGPLRHSGYLRVVAMPTPPSAGSVNTNLAADPGPGASSAPAPVSVAARLAIARRSMNILAGSPVTVRGRLLPAGAGRSVRLEGRFGDSWRSLTRARTGPGGRFRLHYVPTVGVQRHLRVVFEGDQGNGKTSASAGALTVYTATVASWYYDGGSTACGFHAGYGVANLSLPCGAMVRFRYGGRTVIATVDDRGPYVGGRSWDLNQSTAAALGFGGVGTVWVSGPGGR